MAWGQDSRFVRFQVQFRKLALQITNNLAKPPCNPPCSPFAGNARSVRMGHLWRSRIPASATFEVKNDVDQRLLALARMMH